MPLTPTHVRTYLEFFENKPSHRKTSIFSVSPKGRSEEVILGYIKFRGQWRSYVFFPCAQTLYDPKCLLEIAEFLKDLNFKWRQGLGV